MATTITFNDGASATLDNGKVAPFDRFTNWTPAGGRPTGESAARQSDRAITMVRFRTEHRVHFELPFIPSSGASSKVTIADRLIAHLEGGGVCTVNTGDAASTSFSNARMNPDRPPELRLTDRELMEYTLSLDLLLAALPVCRYVG